MTVVRDQCPLSLMLELYDVPASDACGGLYGAWALGVLQMACGAGDAVMGMIVTQLVFASTTSGDTETLHDRRKVMVRHADHWAERNNPSATVLMFLGCSEGGSKFSNAFAYMYR